MPSRSGLTGAQLSYFGVIQGPTGARADTKTVWDAVEREAARRGEALPPGMWNAVNTMRSMAAELRNAGSRLSGASATDAILGSHVGVLPYGNNPSATGGPRTFHVRVTYNTVTPEGPDQQTVTLVYPGNLPATVGELRAEAEILASVASSTYEGEFDGIDAIEIGEL